MHHHLQNRSRQGLPQDPCTPWRHSENGNYDSVRAVRISFYVLWSKERCANLPALYGRSSERPRLLLFIPRRHSCLHSFRRRAQAIPPRPLHPTQETRHPTKPIKVRFPCSRSVIPWVQNFIPRMAAPTGAHRRSANLRSFQDGRQNPTFLGHAKYLPSVPPKSCIHTSSSPQRPIWTQSQGFWPSNLHTGAPHVFHRLQG